MGLATLLRGFKAPLAALNRFFESNGVMPTLGYPPRYDRLQLPGDDETLGPQTALLRTKLAGTPTGAADIHSQNIRIFMPNKEDMDRATHAYVSYANLSVFSQRQIDVTAELLDKTPPDFAKLRSEILGFAREDEESLLRIAGMQPAKEEQNLAGMLFLVVSNEREYSEKGTFLRESDRCCEQCPEKFDCWLSLQAHRREAHGVFWKETALPDDLQLTIYTAG